MQRRTPSTLPHLTRGTQVKELLVLAMGYGCVLSLLALDISLPPATPLTAPPAHNASVNGATGDEERDSGRATTVNDQCAARADAPFPGPAIHR